MESENIAGKATAHSGMPTKEDTEDLSTFVDENKFNYAILINWASAAVAISLTVFFWLLSQDVISKVDDLNIKKNAVISQITSVDYANVEKQASSFKSAVSELKKAQAARYAMDDFLPKLYLQIDKNVIVSNIAITKDGKLSFDGKTDSYRSAAEQLLTLQAWTVSEKHVLRNADLVSVSENIDKSGKAEVPFSITADINKTIDLNPITTSTDSTTTTVPVESTIGGE